MSMSNNSLPAAQEASPNPLLQSYQAWSQRTPYITRISTVLLVAMYIVSFFLPLELFLSNIPYYTINGFQIFRMVTSPFAGNSIFTLLLILITYPSMGLKMEVSMGSGAYLFLLIVLNLLVNVSFVLLSYLCYFAGMRGALLWTCMDFWLILFALITIDCMQMPDAPRRLLFIPYDIPSKYMPLALYALICLFSGPELAYALSMGLGYLFVQGYLDRLRPSSQYFAQLEGEGGWLRGVSRQEGYALAGTMGHDSWIPTNASHLDPMSREGLINGQSDGSSVGGAADGRAREQFPGSGRKLAAGNTTNAGTESGMSFFAPSAPPLPAEVARPSREEIAARRLAALEAGSAGQKL